MEERGYVTLTKEPQWRFAVDRGGTFTDIIGLDPAGRFHLLKLLSVCDAYPDAAMAGIRRILNLSPSVPLPEEMISGIRFGTTVATNALLERHGGKVALLITEGFRDLLEIGNQSRPDIFSLAIQKSPPLYAAVVEVPERLDAQGGVVTPLDEDSLGEKLKALVASGIDAVAVVLMHAWKNPAHELRCGELLREAGLDEIHLSHQAMNRVKIVSRGQSTLVDAYLSPPLGAYMDSIRQQTGRIPIAFMQSSGGLMEPENFKGKDALLSGPAGGLVAVAHLAESLRLGSVVGFDMGGTSTDVSRYDGQFERLNEKNVDGIDLQTEMLNITTVAAGGGSVLWFDGQKMRVGPESAGSHPGPACYGFGGPLTVTDANLFLGRLTPEFFPATFGPSGTDPLDRNRVQILFEALTLEINRETGSDFTPQQTALGFLRLANEKMALALKEISVSKGFDIRNDTLVCFGGAGGQHSCALARMLDMKRILFHPFSSLLSAYGIGLAKPTRRVHRNVLKPLCAETLAGVCRTFRELEVSMAQDAGAHGDWGYEYTLELRLTGAELSLGVVVESLAGLTEETLTREFLTRHERLFGFSPGKEALEIVGIRLDAVDRNAFFPETVRMASVGESLGEADPSDIHGNFQSVVFDDGAIDVPVYRRADVREGDVVIGPAIVADRDATLVVDPGFQLRADEAGMLFLEAEAVVPQGMPSLGTVSERPDPVLLEVFNNAFMNIAVEMGHTLQNTAFSVNIKERLDFSCALFDADGGLIANAPHQPVHLGSMSDTVQSVLAEHHLTMRPGDLYVTNNPYRGGSHLPDMTVICPVFSETGALRFFTASRGHHADVGGTTPGSMPANALHIDEEGVLLSNVPLVRQGRYLDAEIVQRLTGGPYPVRNCPENISNFKAQIAACQKGARGLEAMIRHHGWPLVSRYMGFIQENATFCVQQALLKYLQGGEPFEASFCDRMDDGSEIQVRLRITAGERPPSTVRAVVDFTGTSAQHTGDNLNAPLPVTRSAVLYVLKVVTGMEIPLNSGCLVPVEIIVPENTLLNPSYPAPVACGNVETSQRVVDVLLGALGVAAASQGTMNNLLFAVDGESPYYETIGGGSGAVEGFNGASGVQVHMTNTRMTDPEILELRHPGVRLKTFTLRRNSGGEGRYMGGNGIDRELLFLNPATVTLLTERRVVPPFGLNGGHSGKLGENWKRTTDLRLEPLPHRVILRMMAGESILIRTPGGGGYSAKF